uniref:Uncharacterized protein LOC104266618 n=1 Tax=Phallusia mammillata TaxID=59560 RepID=A0A6F9DJM4_9ASCI|nr:uncharacterized protein LOC104266618 [Phallusia mammillata]
MTLGVFSLFVTCIATTALTTDAFLNKNCPFTVDDCKTEPYNKLRSCKLAVEDPEKLSTLSNSFLCSTRDKMDNNRKKRSLDTSVGNHTVSKRSTCNICMRRSTEQIIYAAEDAEYGTDDMLELLHNPAENLYQKYRVQVCDTSVQTQTHGRTHTCGKQMIEFTAAVFAADDSVRVQTVRYPTTCAFQYSC